MFAIIPSQELLCYSGFPHPPCPIILTVWPAVYSTRNPPLIIELAMKLAIYCKTQHILDSISLWECVCVITFWTNCKINPGVLMACYDYRLWGDFCLVSTSGWEIERNIMLSPSVCERKNILNIGFPAGRQHSHSNNIPPSIHAHFVTVKRGLSNLSHSPHLYKV